VHQGDRHAALSDGGGHALDRAQAHVSAGEDAGEARLEQIGIATLGPAPGSHHLVAGQDASVGIPRDLDVKPVGLRGRRSARPSPHRDRHPELLTHCRSQVGVGYQGYELLPPVALLTAQHVDMPGALAPGCYSSRLRSRRRADAEGVAIRFAQTADSRLRRGDQSLVSPDSSSSS